MNGTIVFFILLLTAECCLASSRQWEAYKRRYGKTYENQTEDLQRMSLFVKNWREVLTNNLMYIQGSTSALLSINKFADLTNEEFTKYKLGYNGHLLNRDAESDTIDDWETEERLAIPKNSTTINKVPSYPASMDWRTLGAVTPVKNQKQCGSCWAFVATGALEAQTFRKYNKLVSLSEQQMVDCGGEVQSGLFGCNGGIMEQAFDYIRKNSGIEANASYPYVAVQQDSCKYNSSNVAANCTGYVRVARNESAMLAAVATIGPIAVSIGITQDAGLYSSGLFTSNMCTSPNNHGVLIVGYGADSKGREYWIIKNSWGSSWGIRGYFHLPRGSNFCGVNQTPLYPLV